MKTSNNITTPATLSEYAYNHNGLSVTILNNRDFYYRLEMLCKACVKTYHKFGGLDMSILENCSTLKALTRDARNYCRKHWDEVWTMADDKTARTHLAYYVAEYVFTDNA